MYATPQSRAGTVAVVVLTNDVWNRTMRSGGVHVHGVVRLVDPVVPPGITAPVIDVGLGRPLQALPTQVLLRKETDLGQVLAILHEPSLAPIEDGLALALGFLPLFADPPRVPPSPTGPTNYPEWAGIYYAPSLRVDDQAKRYVVVSTNLQNAQRKAVMVVRTTSQAKHPRAGIAFPDVAGGAARACCGDLTTVLASALPLKQPFTPQRLSFADMRAIAHGIAETHGLDAAMRRIAR